MRQYISLFKIRFIAGMQYRAAAWAGICTQFFWGFMYIMIYSAFYASAKTPPPMEFSQLVSYLWLQQSFLFIIAVWIQDGELLSDISNGNIAYQLCRPYNTFLFLMSKLLALRTSGVLLRCVPIMVIAFILPAPYSMTLPPSIINGVLFLWSLLLAIILVVAISMFIYILTFITLSPTGSRLIVGVAAEFLAGSVIPVPLMPKALQNIIDWFPFRYTADLPFRIYSGNLGISEALKGISIQAVWIVILICTGNLILQRIIMKKIVIQGG